MMDRELFRQALEALEEGYRTHTPEFKNAIAALRDRLAQPEQEPCGGCKGSGWVSRDPDIGTDQECFVCEGAGVIKPEQEPVFDCPRCGHCCPQRKPLTDEEIGKIAGETLDPWSCARAIEAAHGIKENT